MPRLYLIINLIFVSFQSKRWIGVWNSPVLHAEEIFAGWVSEQGLCSYVVGQFERGEKTNHLHWQGYFEFVKKMTLTGLKKLNDEIHWDCAKGTGVENRVYCTKLATRERGPFEFGKMAKENQGKRNDLEMMKECLDQQGEEAAWEDHFSQMVKYTKGVEKYMSRKAETRKEMTKVEFHYGVPGTGKTELVAGLNPDAYWKSPDKWWDGYSGQSVVVLDEFNGWMPYSVLCRLCDGTPLKVEVKGGIKEFIAKKLVIISNYHPESWYNTSGEEDEERPKKRKKLNVDALLRRLDRDGGIWLHEKGEKPRFFKTLQELSFWEFSQRELRFVQ